MGEEAYTLELKGLNQIIKALKIKPPVIRIGILGSSTRKDGKSDNASIGAAHEFGTSKLPKRSFLREPLNDHLNSRIESSNLITKEELKEVVKTASVVPWLKKISIIAEGIVLEAFGSNGFGKWAPWKGNYTSRTGNILVDTQQLRNSITSEVKG